MFRTANAACTVLSRCEQSIVFLHVQSTRGTNGSVRVALAPAKFRCEAPSVGCPTMDVGIPTPKEGPTRV